MPALDSDPINGLDNYDVADLSDDPFASPPPEEANKKRKEPDSGLGIDEEVDVKKRPRAPNVKLDEERLLGPKGIPKLKQRARDLKIKGKGHEFSDASRLLSFYQLWLDDLFPKAKFLDALNMVEKAGHKKQVMIARNEYINEGKPKNTTADSEGDDPFGGRDSVSRPMDQTTTQPLEAERPKTLEQGRDVPDDDDLYGATPRPSRPIVPIRNDVPEEDDLEALIAEAEGQHKSHKERLAQAEPDEDDLDALMAEAEGQDRTRVSESDRPATDDEDLDALMAEAETQDQTAKVDRHETKKGGKSANAYEDEEAAMQEMEGLW
ncbi:replication fork protection component Swi3-domain-containing protein [Fusarium flagelliforme]|uniref:Chromosome segregation in meiosis protein n=1 Tax=Fusarium flagelliforme TaxID=2675880 RepID=A0A395M5Y6_9HYPO|nr:replication fork protection component Swi3-domain-containing protein [Fusarium flagelliforme]KAH7185255.1 replication fork protection component Swi3-domain-containing protein [Fusarium flagelliforme]RFN43304.1 replication fork protection complex subunit csm3/swi3 [Fusarium flagelliforme]